MGKTIRFNDKSHKNQALDRRGRFNKKFALTSKKIVRPRELQHIWPLVDESHEGRRRV